MFHYYNNDRINKHQILIIGISFVVYIILCGILIIIAEFSSLIHKIHLGVIIIGFGIFILIIILTVTKFFKCCQDSVLRSGMISL